MASMEPGQLDMDYVAVQVTTETGPGVEPPLPPGSKTALIVSVSASAGNFSENLF